MSLSVGVSKPLTFICVHIHTTGCSCVSLVINGSDVTFSRCKQTFNITICARTRYRVQPCITPLVINGSDVAFSRCKQTFNITMCTPTHYRVQLCITPLVINGSDVAFSRCKQTFNMTICAYTHYRVQPCITGYQWKRCRFHSV